MGRFDVLRFSTSHTYRDMSFARNLRLLRKAIPEVLSADVVYAGTEWPLSPDGRFINFALMGDAVL